MKLPPHTAAAPNRPFLVGLIAVAMATAHANADIFNLLHTETSEPGESVGFYVAVSGSTAVSVGKVGANNWFADVFVRTENDWQLQATLTNPNINGFYSVAISGDTIVLGGPGNGSGSASRVAYVFVRSGCDWTLQQTLYGADTVVLDQFANAVAISGDFIVVGAYHDDWPGCGCVDRGSAFFYKRTNGVWTQTQQVSGSGLGAGAHFGWSVAIDGDTAVVGTIGGDYPNTNRAYVYKWVGDMWNQQAILQPVPFVNNDFGYSVAVDGDTVIVGAPEGSQNGAYVFVRSGTTWPLQQKLITPPPYANGYHEEVSGDVAITGGGSTGGLGFVFTRSGTTWSLQQQIPGAPPVTGPPDIGLNGRSLVINDAQSNPSLSFVRFYDGPTIPGDPDLDTDGDSLPDDWELNGIPYVDINGQPQRYLLDLDGDGVSDASPSHIDVFVEVDALLGYAPYLRSLDLVKSAFEAVPSFMANNADCQQGIRLHVLFDDIDLPVFQWNMGDTNGDGVNDWPLEFDFLKLYFPSGTAQGGYFGTAADRSSPDGAAIRAARRQAFRYCIFGVSRNPGDTTGGQAEIGGNDFFVTLGLWNGGAGGTIEENAGTFMHELGHTLGLRHGGGDDINLKPNYYSVMNYVWQSPRPWMTPGSWPLDPGRPGYSMYPLPTLYEPVLVDCQPLVAPTDPLAGIVVPYNSAVPQAPPYLVHGRVDLPIDWNFSFRCDPGPIVGDLNYLGTSISPSPGELLQGFTDWAWLDFNFRDDQTYADGVHVSANGMAFDELDEVKHQALQTILPPFCAGDIVEDGIVNASDLLAVINGWGPCAGCAADIAPVGAPDLQVSASDLLLVINSWGPCP